MPPVYKYRASAASNGAILDISDYFRLYELDVSMTAEEGAVSTSTVTADDPEGTLDIVGHRLFFIEEDAASGSNLRIFAGYTGDRTYRRGDYHRVDDARIIDISLVDLNSVLPRRIFDKDRANRSAETDVARIQWLLTAEESSLIDDDRYFSHINPVAMDAADYRGQTVFSVLDDCAQQSGKNWFLWYAGDTNEWSLWYDFAASSNYTSPLRLSNVLSDVDQEWTYALGADTELKRDPSRVYSGVYLPYDGGFVYSQRASTSSNFAKRDVAMPSINVKTVAKARARVTRYLNDLDTEEDVITTTYVVGAEKVNFLMQGMRVQVKATHLPGYSDWVWMRCLTRQVVQTSEEFYSVTVELVAPTPFTPSTACTGLTATGSFYPLGGSGTTPNESDGNVLYLRPGINWPEVVTPDHVGSWHFPEFGAGGAATVDYAGDCSQNRVRCLVVGEGTIEVHTATYSASARSLKAWLMHADASAPDGYVIDETQTGDTGDTFTFTVSTHAGVNCTHWVEVTDVGDTCGGKWGFSGFDWTAD